MKKRMVIVSAILCNIFATTTYAGIDASAQQTKTVTSAATTLKMDPASVTKPSVKEVQAVAPEAKDNQVAEKRSLGIDNLTGNLTLTSDYMSRGLDQSNHLPALQGGLTYAILGSDFYLNVWGSNVNFPDSKGKTATLEIDTLFGYGHDVNDNISYDINVARYIYPKAEHASYNELNTTFNFYFLTARLSYSANAWNSHHSGTYYNLGLHYDIPVNWFKIEDLAVEGNIGRYNLSEEAGGSYSDHLLGISKKIKQMKFSLQWAGANAHSDLADPAKNLWLGMLSIDFP